MKPSGGKLKRLAEQTHHHLAQLLLSQVRDERLARVFINEVELSADLSVARVYYRTLDHSMSETVDEQTAKALDSAAGFLRSGLAKSLHMRRVPRLYFVDDQRLKQVAEVDSLLRQLPGGKESGEENGQET